MNSSPHSPVHVLIACGGTGGHLFPGISVGEVLTSRGHDVTLLISEKSIDSVAASGHKDLRFEKMPFLAMPQPFSPKMPAFLAGMWRGARECRRLIRAHEVRVVLGMGGFTSFAPLFAGRREKCRTLIHESNAIPGKANRLNARFSDVVLCGLEACKPCFGKHRDVRVVGTPIRTALRAEPTEDAYAFFNLDPAKKTLLVMGGSQGARGINRAAGASLAEFEKLGFQVLHIAGPTDFQEVRAMYESQPGLKHHVADFCHRMELAYRVADLAIARSGASSMAELAYFGVPSLLVPYPFAAEDHQTRNAQIFQKTGAAELLREKDIDGPSLADSVRRILMDERVSEAMRTAARQLAVRDSAERIADLVEEQSATRAEGAD